jgi:serine/threonine-protein kinase
MTEITSRLSTALADRYKIERRLGEGGMATVYLAEDLKHQRKVALKVLKPDLAAVLGAERFVQEIQTTASLQHPHILPLFDSGTAGQRDGGTEFLYYVMPYVEGETLREKLDRETQLSIEEAVRIATEVADALDYAHRHGVVHRDIKPENILLHDGRPMVADFGIALAVSAAAGGRMTETGLSLGTPHYMSPEQATAEKDLTARSDIYSLGSVLYEMLTGGPPHVGGSAQAIIMKIVTEPADPVTKIRKSVPAHVAAATARALEKLAADRFESAAKFADALTNPAFAMATADAASVARVPSPEPWKRIAIGTSALATVLAVMTLVQALHPDGPETKVARFVISVPDDRPFAMGEFNDVDISPDGARFAYIGIDADGQSRAFVRDFDSFDARPVAGSENVDEFAISPDGMEMVLRVDGELRRTGWSGEAPRTIADSASAGPIWNDDGFVYYTDPRGNLVRVPASGGRVETMLERSGVGTQVWADVFPDGRGGLYIPIQATVLGLEPTITVVDFTDRSTRTLTTGTNAVYHANRLILSRLDGSLWVAPFDLDRRELAGEPIAVIEHAVSGSGIVARESFALAATGTLIHTSSSTRGFAPVRVSRDGAETPYPFTFPFNLGPRLSPDGTRLAATFLEGAAFDIHVVDLEGGTATRVTFEGTSAYPEWSADGRRVAFYSMVDSVYQLRWRITDGSAPAETLVGEPHTPIEVVFMPDGRSFVAREGDRSTNDNADLVLYEPSGDSLVRTPLTRTPANERSPMVSPDGRFVAYVSDQSGRDEVYVRETRPSDNVWNVSKGGGREPLWARSGRELFFRGAGKLVRVGVRTEPTFSVTEVATELFPVGVYLENSNHTAYGILPGDQEFIFVKVASPSNRLVVVQNWMDEVTALLEGGR